MPFVNAHRACLQAPRILHHASSQPLLEFPEQPGASVSDGKDSSPALRHRLNELRRLVTRTKRRLRSKRGRGGGRGACGTPCYCGAGHICAPPSTPLQSPAPSSASTSSNATLLATLGLDAPSPHQFAAETVTATGQTVVYSCDATKRDGCPVVHSFGAERDGESVIEHGGRGRGRGRGRGQARGRGRGRGHGRGGGRRRAGARLATRGKDTGKCQGQRQLKRRGTGHPPTTPAAPPFDRGEFGDEDKDEGVGAGALPLVVRAEPTRDALEVSSLPPTHFAGPSAQVSPAPSASRSRSQSQSQSPSPPQSSPLRSTSPKLLRGVIAPRVPLRSPIAARVLQNMRAPKISRKMSKKASAHLSSPGVAAAEGAVPRLLRARLQTTGANGSTGATSAGSNCPPVSALVCQGYSKVTPSALLQASAGQPQPQPPKEPHHTSQNATRSRPRDNDSDARAVESAANMPWRCATPPYPSPQQQHQQQEHEQHRHQEHEVGYDQRQQQALRPQPRREGLSRASRERGRDRSKPNVVAGTFVESPLPGIDLNVGPGPGAGPVAQPVKLGAAPWQLQQQPRPLSRPVTNRSMMRYVQLMSMKRGDTGAMGVHDELLATASAGAPLGRPLTSGSVHRFAGAEHSNAATAVGAVQAAVGPRAATPRCYSSTHRAYASVRRNQGGV